MSSSGTGSAANQPATRTGLRPKRSDSGPAATLVRALVTPKATMKVSAAVTAVRWNACVASSGRTVRLLPEHAADERIDAHQEAELGEVRPESERDGSRARCGCGHPLAIGRFALRQASQPPSRTARLWRPCPSSRLAAVIARSP